MKCKRCRKEIPDESKFCNWCGAPQEQGRMYRRPDGLYEKILTINGKRVSFRGKTEKDVLVKMVKYKGKIEEGPLFADSAKQWYEKVSKELSPNSFRSYDPAYKDVTEEFKAKKIAQITPAEIKGYYASLVEKGFSRKTIATRRIVLRGAFQAAKETFDLEYDPSEFVKIPKSRKEKERTSAPDSDIEKVIQHVDDEFGLFAFIAINTGLRRSEILALQYKDFDIVTKTVCVTKQVYFTSGVPNIKSPKTEKGNRMIPLTDALLNKIKQGPSDHYLFGGKSPLSRKEVDTLWNNYVRVSGITSTPHQFRHYFSSRLYELGVGVKESQMILGHAQVGITLDRYTHLQQKQLQSVADIINASDAKNTQ